MTADTSAKASEEAAPPREPARLAPVGFWSYARQDDELSEGELTKLRVQVQTALQQQFGRDRIDIFQDKETIPHGANWENQIRRSLNKSSFFVPILTPNFLQSEWCCREVELFIQRQAELFEAYPDLPRESRIFPILYVDLHRADVFNPSVLKSLEELQWFDFREFRWETGAGPRKAISGYAKCIRDVLLINVDRPPDVEKPRQTNMPKPGGIEAAETGGQTGDRVRTLLDADRYQVGGAGPSRRRVPLSEMFARNWLTILLSGALVAAITILALQPIKLQPDNQSSPTSTPTAINRDALKSSINAWLTSATWGVKNCEMTMTASVVGNFIEMKSGDTTERYPIDFSSSTTEYIVTSDFTMKKKISGLEVTYNGSVPDEYPKCPAR